MIAKGYTNTAISGAGQTNVDPPTEDASGALGSKTPLFAGYLDTVNWGEADKVAHIMEAPCDWTSYYPVQMSTVNAQAIQYSWAAMVSIWKAMAWNTRRLLRQSTNLWKSSMYLYPIVGWWWRPEAMFEKYRYDLDPKDGELDIHWQLESVQLQPNTGKCESTRQDIFVKHYKSDPKFCYKTTDDPKGVSYRYNLTYPSGEGSWLQDCKKYAAPGSTENPCDTAKCDYPTEVFRMAASKSFPALSPDASRFLRSLSGQLSAVIQESWLSETDLGARNPKEVICAWVKENEKANSEWLTWLPDTFLNTGCRKYATDTLCSGNGKCEANADPGLAGSCKCDEGYRGILCEFIDIASVPEIVTQTNITTFVWDPAWPDPTTFGQGYRLQLSSQKPKALNFHKPNDAVYIAMAIFAGLGILTSLIFISLSYKYGRAHVMRFSQPIFVRMILGSSILSYASIFFNSNKITSSDLCNLSIWLGHLGFVIFFSALFAKTWRLHKLFNNKHLRKVRMTVKDVVKVVAALVSVSLVILLVMTISGAADPELRQRPMGRVVERIDSFDVWIRCDSSKGSVFIWLLLGFEVVLLLMAAFLAFLTRNVDHRFSEAAYVAYAIYTIFIVAILVVGMHYGLADVLDPDGQYVLISLGQFIGTLLSTCLVFVPKLFYLKVSADSLASGTSGSSSTSTSHHQPKKVDRVAAHGDAEQDRMLREARQLIANLEAENASFKTEIGSLQAEAKASSGVKASAVVPQVAGNGDGGEESV
eukprot:g1933.t1